MKMKHLLSAIMALAIVVPTAIPVSADTAVTAKPASGYSTYTWPTTWYNSSDETNFPSSKPDTSMSPKITLDDSKTGDSSIYMKFPTSEHAYCMHYYSKERITLESGKTYEIGAWVKGMDSRKDGMLYFGTENWARVELNNKVETDENGWTLYQKDFTATKDYTNVRALLQADRMYGDNCVVLVDDVFIREKGTDKNLVDNPSFAAAKTTQPYHPRGREALRSSSNWAEYAAVKSTDNSYVMPVEGDGYAYEGNKGLYVHRKASDTNQGYRHIQYYGTFPIDTYTLTIYIKSGTINEGQTSFSVQGDLRLNTFTKTYAGNGWYKYTRENTTTEVRTMTQFYMSGWVTDASYYIDGMSVVDSKGKEYITGGGFEDCPIYTTEKPEMFTAYSASNVNKGDGVVSWINPYRNDITDIKLKVNGEEVEYDADLASRGYNQVVLKNLVQNVAYDCVLEITAGGNTYTDSRVLIPNYGDMYYRAAGNRMIESSGWTLARNETAGNYTNVVLDIDEDVKASGNSSMRITGGRKGTASNVYAALTQQVSLEKNKAYQFSVKFRYVGAGAFIVQGIYNTANGWENTPSIMETSGRERWVTRTYDITPFDGEADDGEKYSRNLQFIFDDGAEAVWIDDVSIYEVSEGQVDTSVNYVRNGGFEFDTEWVTTGTSYQLTYNGEVVADIDALEAGEVLGSFEVRNYEKEDLNLTVVAAVYEDGKLVDVSYAQKDIPVLANPFVTPKLGTSVTVPEFAEGKKYEMKLMLLDSMNNLKPLTEADVFN